MGKAVPYISATYAVLSSNDDDDDDAIIKAFPSSNEKHFVPMSACELEINCSTLCGCIVT